VVAPVSLYRHDWEAQVLAPSVCMSQQSRAVKKSLLILPMKVACFGNEAEN